MNTGSDIYLSWKGMTKEEKDKRITGYSIDAGKFGYLRASIGMVTENLLLENLFPEECWNGKKHAYDFKANFGKLQKLGAMYIIASMAEKIPADFQLGRVTQKQKEMQENIVKMLSDFKMDKIESGNPLEFRFAVMWLSSLFDFFELAIDKQNKGLKPVIEISW